MSSKKSQKNFLKYQANILVVDDNQDNLRLLSKLLSQKGYQVRNAINGNTALIAAKAANPDLILLDIQMPDMDGYQVCQILKKDPETYDIPIIFLTAMNSVIDKVKAFSIGGSDYITKPFHLEEVLIRIENLLKFQAAKAEIRQLNSELENRVSDRTAELERANEKLKQEIVERQRAEKRLLHMAWHDSLTGLPNRSLLIEELQTCLNRVKSDPDYLFAVLFLDCDRFKLVNDSLGHLIGDRVLIAIADSLKYCLNDEDILARLGSDEFTIIIKKIQDISDAIYLAERIHKQWQFPLNIDQYDVFINASIGIAIGSPAYQKPEHILRDADIAMYQAKKLGHTHYQVFEASMHDHVLKRLQLETDLRLAIQRQEFFLQYQPIISLCSGKLAGFEALIRWQHPQQGFVSPGEFIPIAEETGLIVPMGLWVLREACQTMQSWVKKFAEFRLHISVNLSVKQFRQPNLIEMIDQILAETQLHSQYLKLEITETAIMDNAESANRLLKQLKARKIKLSLDDFGTGYSSLSYLHRFHMDTLKIDRSFIGNISEDRDSLEIVEAIVTLAHQLKMDVVAEGVETFMHFNQLRNLGIEFGQGYFFAKPLDANSAEALIRSKPQW
ncbi:two-component system response regulator [Planktothricoides raciborskii]|uniref:EAL domain-containing protein n=1 Tax=Planktothricoides raciborskii FACHB-1370 TaxID=2949576 RepID=A0ABR8EIK9_9CYAN|nr:EAL domain-containing response regulator [Planktothricoides raciborskii]MBD2546701.1 EAL domain-containing protein [Planktothricoides raciborskii FACHB-1370]MBD2582649.1 EAL domain-containing protein [Planktothricoides raciborskii FACHB-1261]